MILSDLQLRQLMEAAGKAALREYMRELYPESDLLTERKAKDFMSIHGERPSLLRKLVENGDVHPQRSGRSANSAKMYRRSELETVLQARHLAKTTFRPVN